MWYTWSTIHGVLYGVIFWHIMCAKVGLSLSIDVDTEFGSGVGGVFEVGVEDEVGSENRRIVNNDSKYEVDLDIGDSSGWG